MDAVLLDGAGDVDEVLVEHGYEGGVVLGGEIAKGLVEGLDVVGAVVGRQGDAGEQDLDVCGFKGGEHGIKIVAGQVGGQAAEAVVTAEFDDHDFRMQGQDGGETGDGVLGGSAAGAFVDDFVVVAVGVESLLQCVGVGLARLKAVAGGDAVSEANEKRLFSSHQAGG